jgi:hypothetical protein
VDDTPMPGRHDLPESLSDLARLNAHTIRHQSFRNDTERLVAVLRDIIRER